MQNIQKVNKKTAIEFQAASFYYKRTFNMFAKWAAIQKNDYAAIYTLRKMCLNRGDKRMYYAIREQALESTKELNLVTHPVYTIRLSNVYLPMGQFMFNGITFTFPELSEIADYTNREMCNASIKLREFNGVVTASIDEDTIRVTNGKNISLYYHLWDYNCEFDPEFPIYTTTELRFDKKFAELNKEVKKK